jgi:poly(3-hydroxybutyrate) depolymerase
MSQKLNNNAISKFHTKTNSQITTRMIEESFSVWDMLSGTECHNKPLDEALETAKHLYNLCVDDKYKRTNEGTITQYELLDNERFYLIHEPNDLNKNEPCPLVVFFHGIYGYCWNFALRKTRWIQLANEHKFIVAFGQARGLGTPIRSGDTIRYGDARWEFKNNDDYLYLNELLDDVQRRYKIDSRRVYYTGQSMGGVFACAIAAKHSTRFSAICSTMGGWPEVFPEDHVQDDEYSVPLMLITGSEDSHLDYTQKAKKRFENAGYPVTYICISDWGHTYPVHKEYDIWKFFQKYSK